MASFFVNRPIVAMVISIVMTIIGVITYLRLPVAQFPNIVPPEVTVSTFYPGASPEVTTSSITAPLERQFGQMPGLNQMSESSTSIDTTLSLATFIAHHPANAIRTSYMARTVWRN